MYNIKKHIVDKTTKSANSSKFYRLTATHRFVEDECHLIMQLVMRKLELILIVISVIKIIYCCVFINISYLTIETMSLSLFSWQPVYNYNQFINISRYELAVFHASTFINWHTPRR